MQIILSVLLISLLIPLILRFIVFKIQSLKSSSLYTFKYPKSLAAFCSIGIFVIFALWYGIYLQNKKVDLGLEIVLLTFYSLFVMALTWQLLKALNFQLVLEEDCMLYRNFLGFVRKIDYKEITNIKEYNDKSRNPIQYKIYIGNKRIVVDNFIVGFDSFPKIMKNRLRKAKSAIQFA